ncbi:MAG: hypothetical protein V4616_09805 [Bacteroidota bacterium]
MIKAGEKVTYTQGKESQTGTVKTGPYHKEYEAHYPDNTPTTFIDDAYDIELDDSGKTVEGIRRRYLKKVH